MKKIMASCLLLIYAVVASAQLSWQNVDTAFGPLPNQVHVYFTQSELEGKPNRAFYIELPLQAKELQFDAITGNGKRYTPSEYFTQNASPLVVVNCTFFSFANNSNLNIVVSKGQLKAYNTPTVPVGKNSPLFYYLTRSAIGINKKRQADVAWVYTDTSRRYAYAFSEPSVATGTKPNPSLKEVTRALPAKFPKPQKWKVTTAVGGGPVVLHAGQVKVFNKEERMFVNGLQDKHPRTAMGYTRDGKLIIVAVEGRNPGIAEGATLQQLGAMLQAAGCIEGLNLDGGGSSCLLINGKPTIKPTDKGEQRPVPAVFIVSTTQF